MAATETSMLLARVPMFACLNDDRDYNAKYTNSIVGRIMEDYYEIFFDEPS